MSIPGCFRCPPASPRASPHFIQCPEAALPTKFLVVMELEIKAEFCNPVPLFVLLGERYGYTFLR